MTQRAPSYGNSFTAWRGAANTAWRDYTRHAFVQGLADGTLPRDAFLHYLVQDYIFLKHFARAWALAVVKSDTAEEMKMAATTVDALINTEMQLHIGICAQAGISEDDLFNATEENANLAYTRYVLDAGFSGDFLDLMAALAPCVFGYGEIGARLADECVPDTPYKEWIDTYASADYQDLCKAVGAMIDTAVVHRLGHNAQAAPRWQHLQARFTKATELEVSFWQMGLMPK